MSLRQQAEGALTEAALAAQNSQATKDAALASEIQDRLADYFGDVTVAYLGVVRGDHPEETKQQWGGSVLKRENHALFRYQVDDIILVWAHANAASDWRNGRLHVEVSCGSCGRQTLSTHMTTTSGMLYRGDDERHRHSYDYARTPESRAKFQQQLGMRLTTPGLCWDCKVGVPRTCPSCGRTSEGASF